MKRLISILTILIISSVAVKAQFYVGPFVGFKASGLKGTDRIVQNGNSAPQGVADASSTGFSAGITAGYQVIPTKVTGGLYKLDLNLDVSWSSFSYFENGFNSLHGAGSFTGNGFSGGGTNMFSFDVMPMNRFNFNNFILSPFVGLGVGVNLLLNSDVVRQSRQAGNYTLSGTSEVKIGLLVFYGTVFNISSLIKPYIQFKHLIPFGSESQVFDGAQIQGGGSVNYSEFISDVPGYFSLTAGVRFCF